MTLAHLYLPNTASPPRRPHTRLLRPPIVRRHAEPSHPDTALAVVSIDGRVLYSNAAAAVVFRLDSGLSQVDGRLHAPEMNTALRVALAAASGLLGQAHASSLRLQRQGHGWRLLCLPMPPAWTDKVFSISRTALLLMVGDHAPPASAIWRQVYGFTTEECRLANWLLHEDGHYAGQFDWLRGSLGRLLQKTGTEDTDKLLSTLRVSSGRHAI